MLMGGLRNIPKLNPIKNIWSQLKHMQWALSMARLKRTARKVWVQVTGDYFKCIYISMLGRIEAVNSHQGGLMEVS